MKKAIFILTAICLVVSFKSFSQKVEITTDPDSVYTRTSKYLTAPTLWDDFGPVKPQRIWAVQTDCPSTLFSLATPGETRSTPYLDSIYFGPASKILGWKSKTEVIKNITSNYTGGKHLLISGQHNMIFDADTSGTVTGNYNVIAGNYCAQYYLKIWGNKDMFWGVDYSATVLKDNPKLAAILKAYEDGFVGTPADTKEARGILWQLITKTPITRY